MRNVVQAVVGQVLAMIVVLALLACIVLLAVFGFQWLVQHLSQSSLLEALWSVTLQQAVAVIP